MRIISMPAASWIGARAARRIITQGLVVASALSLGSGCGLLDTDQPDIIEPGGLETPEGAEALRVGAIHDFGFVKDGDGSQFDTEGLVLLTGDMADEFMHSGFIPSTVEFDQRLVVPNNGSLDDVFFRLHRARTLSEGAAKALEAFALDPDNNAGIPEMLSLAGLTYIYFAEDFCDGVTYSSTVNDQPVFGPQITAQQSLDTAIARFDSALSRPAITVDPDIEHLAAVGKARALLNKGDYTGAAAAVASVPTDFQYLSEHDASPLDLANAIFIYGTGGTISMSNREGGNGIRFRTNNDARVPFFDTGGFGLDQTTPQFDVLKYPDEATSIVVADGIEARLIEAEAALNASDIPGMMTILQDLRDNAITPALPTLGTPTGPTDAVDTLFSERAYWLYATGHRLGDLRRLVTQYGRNVNNVFPVGTYIRGGSYGNVVNFPVPQAEVDQNPNYDPAKCDPTKP
jgi:SusD/RagB-like outer membrane lipoprotein